MILSIRVEDDKKQDNEKAVNNLEEAKQDKSEGTNKFLIINNHDTHGTNKYKPCQKIPFSSVIALDTLDK